VLPATIAAVASSLAADALPVVIAPAAFPAPRDAFQFPDYAKLTVIGVIAACVAWPVVTRISSGPGQFFRMAILVPLALSPPGICILYRGQPGGAVAFLFRMRLAIAVVNCNLLVLLAPVRPVQSVAPGQPGFTGVGLR
jgi:hypothetical protein